MESKVRNKIFLCFIALSLVNAGLLVSFARPAAERIVIERLNVKLEGLLRGGLLWFSGETVSRISGAYLSGEKISTREDLSRLKAGLKELVLAYGGEAKAYVSVYNKPRARHELIAKYGNEASYAGDVVSGLNITGPTSGRESSRFSTYSDRNGRWVSSVVAIRDSAGQTIAHLHADSMFDEVYAEEFEKILNLLFWILVLSFALSLLPAFYLSVSMATPGDLFMETIGRVESGDLSARVAWSEDDEHEHIAAAFNRMVAALEEERQLVMGSTRLAAVGEIAATAAHDIKNPLTSVVSTLDMLHRRVTDDQKSTRLVELAAKGADQIKGIVEQMRELSHSNIEFEDVSLREVINDTIELTKARRSELSVKHVIQVSDDIRVHCDRRVLSQCLINLVVNAYDSMRELGTALDHALTFRGESGNPVALSIADTGTGISDDKLDKIFDLLFTTKSAAEGTGLGLASVRRFLEQMGGSVVAENSPLGGAVFRVTLHSADVVGAPGKQEEGEFLL